MLHAMKLSAFDLNHARALHHLLEEAHVAKAAARLGITPAAASNALRRLRDEIGDPLLVRDGRALVRTTLGEELRGPAREVVAAAERLLEAAAPFDARSFGGDLLVTMSEHVGAALIDELDRLASERAPLASLRIRPIPLDIAGWLRESGGVAVGPIEGAALASTPLYDDRYVCALREGHPLLSGPWTAARFAAAEHVLVTPRGASDRGAVDEALAALGLARRITRAVPSFALALPLLRRSDRVSTLPSSFARRSAELAGLALRAPPFTLPDVPLRVVWHTTHARDPRQVFLRALLHDAAAASGLAKKPARARSSGSRTTR